MFQEHSVGGSNPPAPTLGGIMDRRLMVKVKEQMQPVRTYCDECGKEHEFRYSHLKLDKGNRYHVYVGIGCYQEHLVRIVHE